MVDFYRYIEYFDENISKEKSKGGSLVVHWVKNLVCIATEQGWGKMYTCKRNLVPMLYSGKKKKNSSVVTAAAWVTAVAQV